MVLRVLRTQDIASVVLPPAPGIQTGHQRVCVEFRKGQVEGKMQTRRLVRSAGRRQRLNICMETDGEVLGRV